MSNRDDVKGKFQNFLEIIKKNKYIVLCVIAFLFIVSVFYTSHEIKSDRIVNGVRIDGIKVSGLTKEEAVNKVNSTKEVAVEESKIKFVNNENIYSVPVKELGYTTNTPEVVDEAYSIGRKGNIITNYLNTLGTSVFHKNLDLDKKFNQEKVTLAIDNLEQKVYKRPENANLHIHNGEFQVTKESYGRSVDRKKLAEEINGYLLVPKDIELPVVKLAPTIKEKDLEGIDGLVSEFSTNYSSSIKNRKENIAIGASYFNDLLIKPGEEVSFIKQTGGITEEQGFKPAGVIINGELDSGIGGGICQVSTTLYNALIRADVNILERSNHSRPVHYVPKGTDAAVADGYKDLKFKNESEYPIYIKSFADGDNLEFKIFGNTKSKEYEINIVPKLISVSEPKEIVKYSKSLPEGRKDVQSSGSNGYYYETYRELIKDGEVVKKEKISTSNYIPKNKVIVVGEGSNDDSKDKDSKEKNTKNNDNNSIKDKKQKKS